MQAREAAYQQELKEKVRRCAAAALATGCTLEWSEGPLYAHRNNNMVWPAPSSATWSPWASW